MSNTVAVVIPTWQRASWLDRCLAAMARQRRPPDEVLVVGRAEDEPAWTVANRWEKKSPFTIRWVTVDAPGFMPPIRCGIRSARSDIVAFVDDDAEPLPNWLEVIERHYADASVGGVGGRYVNMDGEREMLYSKADEVGKFYWFGRIVGNMYRETINCSPREVDFFMGGNMSYRRSLLENVEIDLSLNNDVAFNYEVDLGLQVKALGCKLIYDPAAMVRHFSAPRTRGGLRTRGYDAIYWFSHNVLYLTLKHTRGWRRLAAIAYSFLVGDRTAWGIGAAVFDCLLHHRLGWTQEIGAAFSGKARALSTFSQRSQAR